MIIESKKKKIVQTKEPIGHRVICDVCGKVIPKGAYYYSGYTSDHNVPHPEDSFDSFDICSLECAIQKMTDVNAECIQCRTLRKHFEVDYVRQNFDDFVDEEESEC